MLKIIDHPLRAVVALSVFLTPALSAADAPARPNVVIFLADDAGWGDYNDSGNQMVRTPHIDSIAEQGVTFANFYVQPVCAPTRAEFLTGRYHPRTGVYGVSTGQERMDPDEVTVAELFQTAGYSTGAFGKWHNGSQYPYHPVGQGFDEFFGHASGHWGEYFDAPLEDNGRMVRTEGYIVDVCTDRALDFIERKKDGPFFCFVPFTTPHSPWTAPEEDWQRFKDREISQQATDPGREDLDHTRCALAMMENQDRNVGRVLMKLDELGLAENTIVFYFSDNGPNSYRWNGGMRGRKGSTDEGGVRSPAFLRWPGKLPAGHTVEEIAGAIDLLPTFTALAGIPAKNVRPLDGRSLSRLAAREEVEWPDRMIFSSWAKKVGVRTQRHRLDDEGRLYDMIEDPGQTTPVNERDPDVAAELEKAVETFRRDILSQAKRPAKNRGGVDARPFPVGFREFPITMLPARDGQPRGGVKRSSSAPNCSYFVDWTSIEGQIVWNVAVETSGRYAVMIDYTCPAADAGSQIALDFGESRLTGRVEPGWDPPLYTGQDTLPRPPAESHMKPFRTLELGEIELAAGEGELVLRALEMPGDSVMDVRRVTLTLLEAGAD